MLHHRKVVTVSSESVTDWERRLRLDQAAALIVLHEWGHFWNTLLTHRLAHENTMKHNAPPPNTSPLLHVAWDLLSEVIAWL